MEKTLDCDTMKSNIDDPASVKKESPLKPSHLRGRSDTVRTSVNSSYEAATREDRVDSIPDSFTCVPFLADEDQGERDPAFGAVEAKTVLEENKQALAQFYGDDRKTHLETLSKVDSDFINIREQLSAAQERVFRLSITSPVNGIVKGLKADAGTVLPPGGTLMELVRPHIFSMISPQMI